VTVDELVTMVNIALGSIEISRCLAGEQDASGTITVNEIVAAVGFAQRGCPTS
jgi:hypothetical protein